MVIRIVASQDRTHIFAYEAEVIEGFYQNHMLNLQIGQFKDDRQSSRFRTLISHYPPAEVWY